MTYVVYPLLVAAIVFGLILAVAGLVRVIRKWHGDAVVTCPETQRPAGVRISPLRAALTSAFTGSPRMSLADCSRWPERKNCGQECLGQIESCPEDCLLRNIVTDWYAGKECVFCHRTFDRLHWHDRQPALIGPDGFITVRWRDVPAERIREVLANHKPVCWDCHIAETFRRTHAGQVVDRTRRPSQRVH